MTTTQTVAPQMKHVLRDGLEVWCFGKPYDWSLKKYLLEDENADDRSPLLEVFRETGVERVYAPNPSNFTGRIVPRTEIEPLWTKGQSWIHGTEGREARIRPSADGMVIQPGEALYLPTADCPTIIAWCERAGHVIAAHGGLKCLYDHQHVTTGERSRERPSVVDEIMWHLAPWSNEVRVMTVCGIGSKRFCFYTKNHPRAEENLAVLNHLIYQANGSGTIDSQTGRGEVDLPDLVFNQFIHRHKIGQRYYGHRQVTDDGQDTYLDIDLQRNSNYRWWSHRRWDDQDQQGPDGRNGILVIRHR